MKKVLLFYKYVSIEYPKRIQKWQEKLCTDLHLKGRIILAHEGINATVSGDSCDIERYKSLLNEHQLFGGIDFKENEVEVDCFTKISIKVKDEIVRLGKDPQQVRADGGAQHLSPDEVHALLSADNDDLVILDTRNNYESAIGKFEHAITPDIKTFREFPEFVDQNKATFEGKTVLMYCTGGIRCERASAYFMSKVQAKQVYQINGGIFRYVERYPNGFFKGKNYIFDGRLAVSVTSDILGNCFVCKASSDQYTNCLNAQCNRHFIGCADCVRTLENCCSSECFELVRTAQVVKRKPLYVTSCR